MYDLPVYLLSRLFVIPGDWKLVPPPRVGEIIFGTVPHGGHGNVEEACRVTDHTTFVAPQYKQRKLRPLPPPGLISLSSGRHNVVNGSFGF